MPPMAPGEGHGGHDMGGMSGDTMGMMSDEQMTALKNADGVEASRLFLTGMITHHEGAIAMAQNEIQDGHVRAGGRIGALRSSTPSSRRSTP